MRLSIPRCVGLATSAILLVFLMPATSHAAMSAPASISSPALRAQAGSASGSSIANSPSAATAAATSGENWLSCVDGRCTLALNNASTEAIITAIDATPKIQLFTALEGLCIKFTVGKLLLACTVFAAAVAIDSSFLAQKLSAEDTGYGVYISYSFSDPIQLVITPQPAIPVPYITQVATYTQGVFVYFKITYADPGHNAEGFGFVGVNGSGWAEETHPFSSPSYGIVGPNSIAYPFNSGCGTAQQYDSYVQAWIYNTAGEQSQPVTIHLVCSSTGTAG